VLEQGDISAEDTETGLKSAAGFIRRELGSRLRIRVTPEVIFKRDPSVEGNIRITKLLDEIKEQETL
jgi:ribosome-binding factor A